VLDRREAALQRDARTLVDQLAERDVLTLPAWARETFGERPDTPRASGQWDRGVRAMARFRVQHDVADKVPGSDPSPPISAPARRGVRPSAWRQRFGSGSTAAPASNAERGSPRCTRRRAATDTRSPGSRRSVPDVLAISRAPLRGGVRPALTGCP
jgi:hypothetical protein